MDKVKAFTVFSMSAKYQENFAKYQEKLFNKIDSSSIFYKFIIFGINY